MDERFNVENHAAQSAAAQARNITNLTGKFFWNYFHDSEKYNIQLWWRRVGPTRMVDPRSNVHLVYIADLIMMQLRSVELAIRLGGGFDGSCVWWSQSEGGEHWSNDKGELLIWNRSKKQGRVFAIFWGFVDFDICYHGQNGVYFGGGSSFTRCIMELTLDHVVRLLFLMRNKYDINSSIFCRIFALVHFGRLRSDVPSFRSQLQCWLIKWNWWQYPIQELHHQKAIRRRFL